MAANETLGASFSIDTTALKAGLAQANRLIRESESEFKAAASGMDDWSKSQAGVEAKIKSLNSITELQQKKVDALKGEYQKLIAGGLDPASAEAVKLRTQINKEQEALNKNQKELAAQTSALADLNRELNDTDDSLEDTTRNLNDAGDAAQNAADGGFTVFKGALADLVADGIKNVVSGLQELVTSNDTAFRSFQAQTGASADEMKEFESVMQDIYADNFGESMEDVANAMANVKQQTKETDPSKLKEMSENALLLRDTFDMDVGESMRAINMLMNQFGISSTEAFNLVAQGAQNGLDKNGDLLDSINEYSVHYKQQGYSAQEFFNSLANGTAAGTFSVDKLGDAMKEFGIRSKDTAASTDEGFQLVGLSADDMRSKFAQGGESAKAATQQTLEALFNMDDQVKQNQAGVDLFGTMWEDLGKEGVKALMDTNGTIDITKDKLSEMNEAKYDNLSDAFEGMKRSIEAELMPTVNQVIPVIRDGFQWIIDNKDIVIAGIAGIGTAFAVMNVANMIMGVVKAYQAFKVAQEGATVAQWLLNVAMNANPIGLIVAAIAGLVAAFVILWKKCDGFRNFWIGLWDGIKNIAKTFLDWYINMWKSIGKLFSDVWNGIKSGAKAAWDFIVSVFTKAATWYYNTVIKPITGFFSGLWNGLKAGAASAWNGIKSVFSKVGQFFGGIWDTIKEKFTSIGTKIGDAIGGAFKSAINAVLRTVENGINFVPKSINKALGLINKLPGVNISKMPLIDLPRLAKGGVVRGATQAIIGEDGAEAIVPLEKNKQWIKAVVDEMKDQGSGKSVVVNQTNNYSQAHSRYEIYKSKQQTAAAVRLAMARG